MSSYIKQSNNENEVIRKVEAWVASLYGVPVECIRIRSRSPGISQLRFAVWYLLMKKEGISSKAIGRSYGVDHTAVLHGVKRAVVLGISQEILDTIEIGVQAVDNLGISSGKAVNKKRG